jgi:hypothetical protein
MTVFDLSRKTNGFYAKSRRQSTPGAVAIWTWLYGISVSAVFRFNVKQSYCNTGRYRVTQVVQSGTIWSMRTVSADF